MKYIYLELTISWPMSAISETYDRAHNILELLDIFLNISFTTNETERNYY